MRRIVVFTMLSLDGVMQAPGGPEEDPSENFKLGGWTASYGAEDFGPIFKKELSVPFDLLLGRKTYDIFKQYWPQQKGMIGDPFNKAKKYVVSGKGTDLTWKESILIDGDVVAKLKSLKKENGPVFHVWGSSNLVQTLLKNDLIDELRLRIYPVTLGTGKRLFAEGTLPEAFKLIDSTTLSTGVILVNYKRAGKVKTGTVS